MLRASKWTSWIACVALLGALVVGCSKDSQDSAGETAGTGGSGSTSGSSNDDDSSNNGSDGGGTAEPIAAEAFPKPENAEKAMYTSDTSTIMFHQEGTVDDQAKFYSEQLEKLGWTKAPSSEVADGIAFLDFKKGSLSITVTINPLREGKITTIAQGNGLVVPESLDDQGDDDDDDDSQVDDSDQG